MGKACEGHEWGPAGTEPKLSEPLDNIQTWAPRRVFAAKLGGDELPELTGKVFTNADHEVFLAGFQFVSITLQED